MKQLSLKLISVTFITSFIIANLGNVTASASEESGNFNEKEVDELAEVLETLFDKSAVYDDDGNLIGYDKKIVKKELSDSSEYKDIVDKLKKENLLIDKDETNQTSPEISPFLLKENPKWANAKEACFRKEMKKSYGPAALTAVWEAAKNGQWKKGAKKLIKSGVKGSLPGIAATIVWTNTSCGDKASKKYDHFL